MNKALIPADQLRFFCGSSNRALAAAIAGELGVPLDETRITRFSNDNLFIQLGDTVRYRRVYIVQSLSQQVNDHLMELLMMLDIARSAAASEVHAIIPYYSYARSDKKDAPRISITAQLVADLLKTAGATHVMSMLFHSPQVHGFFSVPTDPLSSWKVFKQYLETREPNGTGATTVAEITALGKAAVFIPFPYAADDHQRLNARQMVAAGAAEMIAEQELNGERLAARIDFYASHPEVVAGLAARAARLGKPDAARRIVDECCRLAAARARGQRANKPTG